MSEKQDDFAKLKQKLAEPSTKWILGGYFIIFLVMSGAWIFWDIPDEPVSEPVTANARTEQQSERAMNSLLSESDVRVVTNVQARRETLTITVTNDWFRMVRPVQLQSAQNLQAMWAKAARVSSDKARITVEDQNGNEIAGSRIWDPTAIWLTE